MSTDEGRFWDATYAEMDPEDPRASDVFPLCVTHLRRGEHAFAARLRRFSGCDVLSVGGGVDRFAVQLCQQGNRVATVDVSPVAGDKTAQWAARSGCGDRLTVHTAPCEEVSFRRQFDLVVAHHALHHMSFDLALDRIRQALRPGGELLAEEPACLIEAVRTIHRLAPLTPDPRCRTEDEFELSRSHLAAVRARFADVTVQPLDLVTRESVVYLLHRLGLDALIPTVGRLDGWLLQTLPFLTPLASYVLIQGHRPHEARR